MMQDSDESLLKSFAAHRDEQTFRALANRYLGLIFQTSLRRTGSRQIAEEVSQNILCALAKKATSLSRHPERLAAWLHRATLFESSKAMRSESSYQRRKALRHPDETAAPRPPESERWVDAIPHLDTALDQLSETDRQVLLLHYFEKCTYPRIASRLGKSPEAVKKQSQRAMEKLAHILRARGVPLSLTVIATGLTSEFAKAAPLPLIQSAAAAAFAGHTTYFTTALTLMFASKSKIVIPLAILLCAIPIGLQQLAISNAVDRNRSLRAQLASAASTEPGSTVALTAGSTTHIHGLSTSTDIMVLVDEYDEARRSQGLGISSGNQRIMRFKEKLATIDPDTLVRLIRECAGLRIQFSKKSQTFDVLIEELGARDSGLAVRVGTSAVENESRMTTAIGRIGKLLASWAMSDPGASWAWLQLQQGKSTFNRPFRSAMRVGDWLQAHFAASMISIQSPLLGELFHGMPAMDRAGFCNLLVTVDSTDVRSGSTAEADWALNCVKAINEFAPETDRAKLLGSLIAGPNCQQLLRDPDALRKFLLDADFGPDTMQSLLPILTFELLQRIPLSSDVDAKQAELRKWLEVVSPHTGGSMIDEVKNQTARRTIEGLQKNKAPTDDQLLRSLTSPMVSYKSHLPAALELADRIKDPVKRAAAIEHLNKP